MAPIAGMGHGSEGLAVFPPTRSAVVEFGEATGEPEPGAELEGVLFEGWAEDPDPDEIPLVFGPWAGALTGYDVQFEA